MITVNIQKFQIMIVKKIHNMKDSYHQNVMKKTFSPRNSVKLLVTDKVNKLTFDKHIFTPLMHSMPNSQTRFKNIAAFAANFLKCV